MENLEDIVVPYELTLRVILRLGQAGVREITLTKGAAKALTGSLKGVYKPDSQPVTSRDSIGAVGGITFYVED